jgi:hypothetical protein
VGGTSEARGVRVRPPLPVPLLFPNRRQKYIELTLDFLHIMYYLIVKEGET